MGVGSSTPFLSSRSRPGRSVMSMLPSGSHARLHGLTSPLATIDTLILCCSAVSSTQGPSPSGARGTPGRAAATAAGAGPAARCVHTSDTADTISASTRPAWTTVASIALRVPACIIGLDRQRIAIGLPGEPVAPFEPQRREDVRELVDVVARQALGGEVLVDVDAVAAPAAAGAPAPTGSRRDSGRPRRPSCRIRPRRLPCWRATRRPATPMPGELAPNVALSFIHNEPQPVWISTTSPGRMSTFCRCSAPVRSATVIAYGALQARHALVLRDVDQHAARDDGARRSRRRASCRPSGVAKSARRLPL